MATITTLDTDRTVLHHSGDQLKLLVSDVAVAGTDLVVELDATSSLFDIAGHSHVFIGVEMWDDAGGGTGDGSAITNGGSSVFTIAVKTENTKQFESITDGTILASAPVTRSVAANLYGIRVTDDDAGLTAGSWRVIITANKT